MCGIAGTFSKSHFFEQSHTKRMTDTLSHRGPDASGFFFDETVGLGHRRLSILDLSEGANQPLISQNDRFVIVFNGEVYNYQDLKKELSPQAQQHIKTTSDTEVILELLSEKGLDAVQLFNGMFAIALYDKLEKKLWLIRDRLGIKPIYYFWDGRNLAFASELKALLTLPIPKEIDSTAIADYLHLGYVPAPKTIYQQFYKLPTGSIAEVSSKGLEVKSYWSVAGKVATPFLNDEKEAKKQLKQLLQSSVKYRLIADVPWGVFLSGGVDSSLVAGLATEQADKKVKTFSIGFKENTFNEASFAKKVAEHLGSEHHELMVSTKEAKNLIPQLIDIYDEPYADSSAVPTLLVSKMARQHVTVALGGDGGDELFLGYGMYQWADRLQNPLLKPFRKVIAQVLKLKKSTSFQKASALFNYNNEKYVSSHIFSQEQFLFSQAEIQELLQKPTNYHFLANFHHFQPASFRQSIFDLAYYLPDDLLVKIDRATMQYALEARVPLLDYRVVEFALGLSPSLKYKNGERKYLLKQVLYDYVPESLFQRPKQGFAIPLVQWLRQDLKFLIENHLSEKVVNYYGVINYSKVKQIKQAYLQGNDYFYNRLWSLIVLHQFLHKHESYKQ